MARSFASASTQYLSATFTIGKPYTVAAWFNVSDISGGRCIWSQADSSVGNERDLLALWNGGSGDFDTVYAVSTSAVATSFATNGAASTLSPLSTSTWYHGCGIFAADNDRRAFTNGGSKGTNTNSVTIASPDRSFTGRLADSTPNYEWDGQLAELAIWSVALSDEEVASLGAGFCPLFIRPASLVIYAPLGGIYTPSDADKDIIGANALTPQNSPTTADHPPGLIYPAAPQLITAPAAAPPAAITPALPLMGVG